ncbi:hypothetical protein GCM10023189_47180 [Nibrella saemangeumensis]|uniref:Uncharacterized protein n=1 Tax=Nibrella saemangeumensis TaxID=1084526 RepID=A0ABP8NEA3_9BACT
MVDLRQPDLVGLTQVYVLYIGLIATRSMRQKKVIGFLIGLCIVGYLVYKFKELEEQGKKDRSFKLFVVEDASKPYEFAVTGKGLVNFQILLQGFVDDSATVDLHTRLAKYKQFRIMGRVDLNHIGDFYEGREPLIITYTPMKARKGQLRILARTQ